MVLSWNRMVCLRINAIEEDIFESISVTIEFFKDKIDKILHLNASNNVK